MYNNYIKWFQSIIYINKIQNFNFYKNHNCIQYSDFVFFAFY